MPDALFIPAEKEFGVLWRVERAFREARRLGDEKTESYARSELETMALRTKREAIRRRALATIADGAEHKAAG